MSSYKLSESAKLKIQSIIEKRGGRINEQGVILDCDLLVTTFREILKIGGLICYCGATRNLIISDWEE